MMARTNRKTLSYGLFLALPIALFLVFYVYPIISTVCLSLYDWDGISPHGIFVGLRNYFSLFGEPRFYHTLLNNLQWLVFLICVPTALGLALAAMLDQGIRGASFFRVVFFLPFTIPAVAVAAIWRWIYEPTHGLVTSFLTVIGLAAWAQNWLGDPRIVNYSLMGAMLWWTTGFSFLVFFAGLRNLPTECIEAARIEGASPWQIFWHISFPLLWPSTIVVLGMASIDAMRLFDIVWATTSGGPAYASEVLATQMYDVAFGRLEMGKASAISVCLLVISGAFILPYIRHMSKRVQANES